MAHEFVVKHGLISNGDIQISGSLYINGGQLIGTASWASQSISSSYATNAGTAYAISFVPLSSTSASYASSSTSASYVPNLYPQTYQANTDSASFASSSISSSYALSASWAPMPTISISSSYSSASLSSSYALSASWAPMPVQSISSSWASSSISSISSSYPWKVTGSNTIYIGPGNVGIGVNNPNSYNLDVNGTARFGTINSALIYQQPTTFGELLVGGSIGGLDENFSIVNYNGTDGKIIQACYYNGTAYYSAWEIANTSSAAFSNLLLMKSGGNVGIGTATPQATLHVQGNISASSVTASLLGTSSWALLAVSASYYPAFPTNIASASFASSSLTASSADDFLVRNNLTVNGILYASQLSSSKIYITSSQLTVTDNIITINALTPHLRYAGLQMYDSGSTSNLASFLWDGQNNYFFLSSSDAGYSRKIITGPDNEGDLTLGYIPVATGSNGLINSIISQNGTVITVQGTISASAITASLLGTASWANNALISNTSLYASQSQWSVSSSFASSSISASYVASASYYPAFPTNIGSASFASSSVSSSYALSASYAPQTAFPTTIQYANSASWVSASAKITTADTASYVSASNINGTVLSASYAITASYSLTGSNLVGFNFNNTQSVISSANTQSVIIQFVTGSYIAAFFDYAAVSASNIRAGTVFGSWVNGFISYTETSNVDIGDTSAVTMSMGLSGATVQLSSSANTNQWTIRAMGRYL